MKYLSILRVRSTLYFILAVCFMLLFGGFKLANASVVTNGCSDILILFARGSSDNPNSEFLNTPFEQGFRNREQIPGAFFQAMKTNLDRDYPHVTYKAVSIHNFPNLYNNNGYRAVGIFGPKTINNIFDAELSWWPFGEYRDSVSDGVEETIGYIRDQQQLCPDQSIVLGGYSQGANVIGDSLFQLNDSERSKVDAVVLFGDPKYIASNITNGTPVDYWANPQAKPKSKPWKRGNAELKDRGSLDARIPYLPDDMANKTMSWCFDDDFVCSGGSGILQTVKHYPFDDNNIDKNDLGAGHTRYVSFGAPQAASETEQRLSPKLGSLERSRGGKDPELGLAQPAPLAPDNRSIDVMFMVNTSYGVDDVIGQMRQNTTEVLPPFSTFFSDVMYGLGDYGESGETDRRIPRINIDLLPTDNLERVNFAMNRKLAFGSLSGGGVDFPDPHQLAIEKGSMVVDWRDGSTKHLVIITDRPFLESVTYNMCNSDVRIGFGTNTTNNCSTNPILETDSSKTHSERCVNTYQVLTQDSCSLNMPNPGYRYDVSRKINDAITIAEAKGIAVSFIVPHAYRSGTDPTQIKSQFKKVANDTGGLFLEYEAFTRSAYTDAVWRILNHHPKKLPLAALDSFNTLGSIDSISPLRHTRLTTNTPVFFDATSENTYQEYRWDFDGDGITDEVTSAPNTEHMFTKSSSGFFASVAGFNSGVQESNSILPITVEPGEAQTIMLPPTPQDVSANQNQDGSINVSWSPINDGSVIFVGLPSGNIPIISSPSSNSSLTIPGDVGLMGNLVVWTENYDGTSDKVTVSISPFVQPEDGFNNDEQTDGSEQVESDTGHNDTGDDIVEEQNNQEPSDKVIQESESAPSSQFIGTEENNAGSQPLVVTEESTTDTRQTYNPQSGSASQQNGGNTLQQSQSVTQVAGLSIQQSGSLSQALIASETTPKATASRDLVTPTIILLLIMAALAASYVVYRRAKSRKFEAYASDYPDDASPLLNEAVQQKTNITARRAKKNNPRRRHH